MAEGENCAWVSHILKRSRVKDDIQDFKQMMFHKLNYANGFDIRRANCDAMFVTMSFYWIPGPPLFFFLQVKKKLGIRLIYQNEGLIYNIFPGRCGQNG